MFLTGQLIDGQDFIRNLFNCSYFEFFAVFALDYSFILSSMVHFESCSVARSVLITYIIGHNYHGHYLHGGGLSVNNYVRENKVREVNVRE